MENELTFNDVPKVLAEMQSEIKQIKNLVTEMPKPENEKYLSTNDVMLQLGVSRPTLHRWRKEGKIRYATKGGRIVYPESAVREFINPANYE